MRWWDGQPEAWRACRTDPYPPDEVMRQYAQWIRHLPGEPVFVAYPAGFDFTFVNWYLFRFVGSSPFYHAALDIRSYAMAVLNSEFSASGKRSMPQRWFNGLPHTHVALDDAIEQGALFCNMLAENSKG
jgi:DNA polymerase III alpha subunit (gram-positive type)